MSESNQRLPWWLCALIVVLCCLIAYLGALRLTPERAVTLDGAIALPVYATQECAPLGDGVIYYDGTLLYALNGTGGRRWSYLAGANAGFDAGSNGVASWTGSQLTLLAGNTGETVFSVTMAETVISAKAGSQYVAVCIGESEDAVTMVLLDREGKEVDTIPSPDVTLMDYGFFNNGNLFWMLTLDTDGTVPVSRIDTYKPAKTQTGSIVDTDQVVYKVLFYSTQIRAVGSTYARLYDYTGAEDSGNRLLVYGWYLQDLYGNDENPLMVFVPMADTASVSAMQDLRIVQGSKDRNVRLPYECKQIYAGNNIIYGFTDRYLVTCTPDGLRHEIYELPYIADSVIGLTEDMKAVIISDTSVYMVPLPR